MEKNEMPIVGASAAAPVQAPVAASKAGASAAAPVQAPVAASNVAAGASAAAPVQAPVAASNVAAGASAAAPVRATIRRRRTPTTPPSSPKNPYDTTIVDYDSEVESSDVDSDDESFHTKTRHVLRRLQAGQYGRPFAQGIYKCPFCNRRLFDTNFNTLLNHAESIGSHGARVGSTVNVHAYMAKHKALGIHLRNLQASHTRHLEALNVPTALSNMENSISGMIEEQNEYVGYNSDDSEMEENLQHEAGWSEDEFDIAYDEFDNDDNHGEHTDDQNDENHGEHTDSLNTSEAQFDTQLEYDYYGESDLDTGHTDDVEGASVPEDSVDMSQATPSASQPEKPQKGSNGNEYPDSARDLYWMIKEMTFISEAAAYSFYNRYAFDYGFSVRLDQVKRFDDGVIRLRRFVCSRQGRRPKNQLTTEGRVYRHRPESRCGCKARLVVKFDGRTGFWVVEDFRDKHNHDPAEPCQTPFLRSHRTINDAQRSEILSMGSMGIRKHLIMRKFIAGSGSFAGVGFTRKDLYNMCSRERRRLLFDGDATTAIRIMSKRKKRDPEFFFEYDVDEKGRLKHMFWCDSQSRRDYQDYGDVLVFDSTYKMNKYKMPFVPFVGLNNHRRTTVFGCAILSNKTLLDTTCSGSFTSNKEEFKRDLLDRIKENSEDWENDKGKESGYADKPPFKPLPPKEGNEEKEEKKKKKKGKKKKKKKENKKKERPRYGENLPEPPPSRNQDSGDRTLFGTRTGIAPEAVSTAIFTAIAVPMMRRE
ncbi:hypothetical protein QYE76_060841 [Lolium multiflorum]|uniref:Protein FAR1-RELATED SEQUENCE n=1 Tax=Lolium multiflorum TaxID=4521 RepID=A0AAD8W462_LOLMU|nr:hypothetical protein QYE76_060841 [Lolium multiflorum]